MAAAKTFAVANALGASKTIPAVGYGCWKVPKDICADIVEAAIKSGYRHLDCAADYGNEKEVGQGIKRAIDAGIVKREDLWVTSKLWNTFHESKHVKAACQRTLSDLGLDYLDNYLIHFPISLKFVPFEKRYPPEWFHDPDAPNPKMELIDVPVQETWQAMEALHDAGLVKNIGLSNFNCQGIRDVMSYARVKPAVLQVEIHPYLQQPNLVRYAQSLGIHVTAFSPMGHGASYWNDTIAAIREPVVKDIAKKHGTLLFEYNELENMLNALIYRRHRRPGGSSLWNRTRLLGHPQIEQPGEGQAEPGPVQLQAGRRRHGQDQDVGQVHALQQSRRVLRVCLQHLLSNL